MPTLTPPLAGTFATDPRHSTIGFVFPGCDGAPLRATFRSADVRLSVTGAGAMLAGRARVDSLAMVDAHRFRDAVLDLLDPVRFPEVRFVSDSVVLAERGAALVRGTLTVRGRRAEVHAAGRWARPVAASDGVRAGLSLRGLVDLGRHAPVELVADLSLTELR